MWYLPRLPSFRGNTVAETVADDQIAYLFNVRVARESLIERVPSYKRSLSNFLDYNIHIPYCITLA